MNLSDKKDKVEELECIDFFVYKYVKIAQSDFGKIKLALFELKEAIYRLKEYLYYSDSNPFSNDVSYVKYARFIYESYLNDTYIIQTRFRKLINVVKSEKRLNIFTSEIDAIENDYKNVVFNLQKITKEKRGAHVHERRYNDLDFMTCDSMERQNNLVKRLTGKPIKEYKGMDVYESVAISQLDDVQNLIIEHNAYIYNCINVFLKDLTDFIYKKIFN